MSAARVLVLDDEPEFGEFVRRVAEKMGCEVEVIQRATDFQERLPTFNPTLIVLDVVMPEIDGIEILKWLAARSCQARILVVTGFNPRYTDMAGVLGDAIGLDIETHTKPISLKDLRAAIAGGEIPD